MNKQWDTITLQNSQTVIMKTVLRRENYVLKEKKIRMKTKYSEESERDR